MKVKLGILAAGLLALGAGGCVTDGYGYGSDYGYAPRYGYTPGYAPGYAYAPRYSDGYRTCVRRERVWDPYSQRMITVRQRHPC